MNDRLTTDEACDSRQPESEGRVVLQRLVSELKADCNRYANGICQTLACLKRGGYQRGDKPDYETATCVRHEEVKALETLLANSVLGEDASDPTKRK